MARMCHNSNTSCTTVFILLVTMRLSAFVLASSISENSGSAGKFCPKICTCDVIEDLKRADCSNEKLVNTYTDVPYDVEILDLSINIISSIENDNFMRYDNLVKLFLSENSIQTISLDAFANQHRLTTLDLSYNRLEQLNEHLFERNLQLIDVNLSGNNFMMLPDTPFLKSYSIMFLHLSNCRIPHIFDTMFIDLPNLKSLDLSKNIMNSLATVPFAHLRKLASINLIDNRWNCKKEDVRNTVRWIKARVPTIAVDSCLLSDLNYQGNRFERIMEDPALNDQKHNRHDVAIDQVWGTQRSQPTRANEDAWPAFMNKTCSYTDLENDPSKESCEQFVDCQRKYSELYHAHKLLLSRKDTRRSGYFRTGVFIGGVLVGVMLGSFLTYTICWVVRSCRIRSLQKKANLAPDQRRLQRELRREIRGRNQFEHTRLNESPVFARSDRVPGAVRGSAPPNDEIYRNHEHTRQFLVNLFSKRQPRYVRSNSQLANINNRYIPPTQTRDEPRAISNVVPRAVSDTGQLWEHRQDSNNREQESMLANEPDAAFRICDDLQPTWISIRPNGNGTLTRSPRARKDVTTSGESPPPPYVECTLDAGPNQERVNMY
ncbi:leucine-rich repeat-containing G-protein coupled receptor 4 [Anopheles marshallii]|uniref:leucine-rich repeat-containing G-protein coupled receptor 4 n=1 Tax=Anopheles marshallii TaxID=1521116 RepID=UPI00237BABCB|nr:leucine-rich repeat-containing G-protein coupled receptor 4 [Anopheles marshallii]